MALRKELDLYANVRPCKTYAGVPARYTDVDLVIVRENTEDLYAGIEHMVGDDAAETIKIITRKGSERIVRYAFDYAAARRPAQGDGRPQGQYHEMHRRAVSGVARDVAAKYPTFSLRT